jgi:hypothetical protein
MLLALGWANTPGSNPVPPPPSVDNIPVVVPAPPGPSVDNVPVVVPVPPRPGVEGTSEFDPPVPLLPLNGDTTIWQTPLLMVEPYPGFVLYHFCIWDHGTKIAEKMTWLPFWLAREGTVNLAPGTGYHWSCRVQAQGRWSEWFEPHWVFSLAFPCQPPTPLTPARGARINTVTPLLSVIPNSIGGRYDFLIEEVGSTFRLTHESRLPFWRVPEGAGFLRGGATYRWSCRVDIGGWSRFSEPWDFSITDPGSIQSAGGSGLAFSSRAVPELFRNSTVINYTLPEAADVAVTFYTVQGNRVKDMRLGAVPAGSHQLTWNGTDEQGRSVARGVYVYRLRAGSNELTNKLTKTD